MTAFHLTYSTRGREPVAPGEATRRLVVRAILRVAGDHVVLFCVVDDHVHVVVLCSRQESGQLARRLVLALRAVSPAHVERAHIRPVATRAHAEWLVTYVLGQSDRHGLDIHPALWSGSCFAELAGARAIDGWRWNVAELLPRLRLREAFAAVGLSAPLEPASLADVRALGAWRLAAAAAFATGADPRLSGNGAPESLARRAVASLGRRAELASRDLAAALGVHRDQVARLANRGVPDPVDRAVRLRLALEEAVRAVPSTAGAGAAAGAPTAR